MGALLDLLRRLSRRTATKPLLLLTATQDGPYEAKLAETIDAICGHLDATVVDLDLAMRTRGSELVAAYARAVVPGVSEQFIAQLATHTGGHPLFVVELVNHLVAASYVHRAGGAWRDNARIDWHDLPTQVTKVLDTQIMALGADVREVLQTASVEGDQFTVEIVAGVMERSAMSIVRVLSRRVPKNLIEPLGHVAVGGHRTTQYRFCHSLARHHSYQSIDPIERTYLHEAVGERYAALADDPPGPLAAQLAFHYDQAKLSNRAQPFYVQAAAYAESTGSLTEAAIHLERAIALASEDQNNATLHAELAKVRAMTGDLGGAAASFDRAVALAEQADGATLADILVNQTHTLVRLHRFDAALAAATRALRLASGDDRGLRAAALDALSNVCRKRGDHRRALGYLDEALQCCEGLDDDEQHAQILYRRGWCLKELGRYDDASTSLQESLAIQAQDRPNWWRFADTHNALADLSISIEHYSEARAHLRHAIDAWRKFDQHTDIAVALTSLANLANREQMFDDGLAYSREAYALDAGHLGEGHPDVAFSLTCIGESNIGLGRFDAAIEALARADHLRTANEVPEGNRAWTRWLLGRTLTDSNRDSATGMALVHKARAVFEAMGPAAASELKDVDAWLAERAT